MNADYRSGLSRKHDGIMCNTCIHIEARKESIMSGPCAGCWDTETLPHWERRPGGGKVYAGSLASTHGQIERDCIQAKSDGSTASYYELPEGATELQDLISFKDMNAQVGEAFRSLYRFGQSSHSGKIRDAKKVIFYMQAEIARIEKYDAP